MRYVVILFLLSCSCFGYSQSVNNLLEFVTTSDKAQIGSIHHAALAYQHGNFKYGMKQLKKQMKREGEFYDGFLFLGYAEKELENYKNAIAYFNQSIKINPDLPISHFMRGNTYMKMKNYRLALRDYKKCINLDASFYPAYNNLALTKVFNQGEAGVHKNDFRLAKRELTLLLDCDANKAEIEEIYFNLGLIHFQLNQYYEAMCFFKKAENSEMIKNKAVYYGAVSKFNTKLYSNAATDFKRVKENNYRSEECEKYLSLIGLIIQHKNE